MLAVGGKKGQDIQASRHFQLLIINAEEEKKIFCQCILIGASYPYPGIPKEGQEGGFKPTNQSNTLPKELKRGY